MKQMGKSVKENQLAVMIDRLQLYLKIMYTREDKKKFKKVIMATFLLQLKFC